MPQKPTRFRHSCPSAVSSLNRSSRSSATKSGISIHTRAIRARSRPISTGAQITVSHTAGPRPGWPSVRCRWRRALPRRCSSCEIGRVKLRARSKRRHSSAARACWRSTSGSARPIRRRLGRSPNRTWLSRYSGARSSSGFSHHSSHGISHQRCQQSRCRSTNSGSATLNQAPYSGPIQRRASATPRSVASQGLRGRSTAVTASRRMATGPGQVQRHQQPAGHADRVLDLRRNGVVG